MIGNNDRTFRQPLQFHAIQSYFFRLYISDCFYKYNGLILLHVEMA